MPKFRNPWRTLTPAEMLSIQLARAENDRLISMTNAEDHEALALDYRNAVTKFDARIARVKNELKAITEHHPNQKDLFQ